MTEIAIEQSTDCTALRSVHEAAFGRVAEADLVDELRKGGWAEISLVAKVAGGVIGHVLFSRLDAPVRALALAPVAVRPERQRSGIGSKLIRAGLTLAAARGWEAVFVLGDPAFYQRFGFSLGLARGYESPYAGDYFMALMLRGQPACCSGVVRYPPPFADLE